MNNPLLFCEFMVSCDDSQLVVFAIIACAIICLLLVFAVIDYFYTKFLDWQKRQNNEKENNMKM